MDGKATSTLTFLSVLCVFVSLWFIRCSSRTEEEQAKGPLSDPKEMGLTHEQAVARPELKPLGLIAPEKKDLVAFLVALNGDKALISEPARFPIGLRKVVATVNPCRRSSGLARLGA